MTWNKKNTKIGCSFILAVLLISFFGFTSVVSAQVPPPTPDPNKTPVPTKGPTGTPDPGNNAQGQGLTTSGVSGNPSGDDSEANYYYSSYSSSSNKTVNNIVKLGTSSLIDAFAGLLQDSVTKASRPVYAHIQNFAGLGVRSALSYDSRGMAGVLISSTYPTAFRVWKVVMGVSSLLFPLLIVTNIAQVYISGLSAPVARAEMLQSIAFSLGRMALAGSSFWIADRALRLGWGIAGEIAGGANKEGWIALILSSLVVAVVMGIVPGFNILAFFLFMTIMFLTLFLVIALLISQVAFVTVVVVWVVIAPFVVILGGMPFFNWVYGLWMKLGTGVILLPIANAILFRLTSEMLPKLEDYASAAQWVNGSNAIRVVICLGFMGLILTIDGMMGKFLYSSLLPAAKMALKSMKGAASLVGRTMGSIGGYKNLGDANNIIGKRGPGGGSRGPGGGIKGHSREGLLEERKNLESRKADLKAAGTKLNSASQALGKKDDLFAAVSKRQVLNSRTRLGNELARTDKALAANKFSLASLGGTQASDGSGGRVRDKLYNGMRRGMFTNNPSLESMDNLPQTIKDAQSKTWDALTNKDAGNHLETFERAYGNNEAGLNSITSSIARLYLGDGPVAQSYQSTDGLMDMDTANANLTTAKDVFLGFNEPGLKLTGHLLEHLQHRQSVKQDFITPDDLMSDLKHFKDPGE